MDTQVVILNICVEILNVFWRSSVRKNDADIIMTVPHLQYYIKVWDIINIPLYFSGIFCRMYASTKQDIQDRDYSLFYKRHREILIVLVP